MRVRVLGCYGGEAPGLKTTCFQINDDICIDAGAITTSLPIKQQAKISHILLSHTHVDHILNIGFLGDNIFGMRDTPVEIISIKPVINILKKHFLNNQVWPDFTAIPTPENPVLTYREIKERQWFPVNDKLEAKAVRTNHPVPCVGYILRDKHGSILYSGDTGPTEKLWKEVNKEKNLRAMFVETAFPNEMEWLADLSGHLTPGLLKQELGKVVHKDVPVNVYHWKPTHLPVLKKELNALKNKNLHYLKIDDTFNFN